MSVTSCPTSKTVGSIVNISSTAVNGTAPYEVIIKKDGVEIYHTPKTVLENAPVLTTYTVQSIDAGKIISMSSYIIDSCSPTNQTSITEICSFSVPLVSNTGIIHCAAGTTGSNFNLNAQIWLDGTYTGMTTLIGTWQDITGVSPGTHTVTYKLSGYTDCTQSGILISTTPYYETSVYCIMSTISCPALTCSFSITPTTITLGQYITWTSTAIGGQGDASHTLYMDGVGFYDTGPGWGAVSSASIAPTTSGTHTFYSIVYDQCTPQQSYTSSTVTVTVNPVCIPTTSTTLSIVSPTTLTCGGSVPVGTSVTLKATNVGSNGPNYQFELWNVSNPLSPVLLTSWTTIYTYQQFNPVNLSISGTYNFQAKSKGTCETIYNDSNICNITVTAACPLPSCNLSVT